MQNLTLKFIIHLLMNGNLPLSKRNPWVLRFTNIDVNEKVNLFNKTITKTIFNYNLQKTILTMIWIHLGQIKTSKN